MAITVRYYTVVVREADLDARLGRARIAPQGLREDGLVRWVCRSPAEGIAIVKQLEGLGFREPSYIGDDIAVIDERRGLLAPCPWLDVVGDSRSGWRISLRTPDEGMAEG